MRHDPAVGALVMMLGSLKMRGVAQAVDELAQQGAPAFEAAIPVISQLFKAETAEREVRSMAYSSRLRASRPIATGPASTLPTAKSISPGPTNPPLRSYRARGQCRVRRPPRYRKNPSRHHARRGGHRTSQEARSLFSTVDLVNA